ncbi:MAG: hypothetical protein JKX95_09190 [Bacteroidia bacterium]|nr:hypothetical protein [Bacteroidia bacterium]
MDSAVLDWKIFNFEQVNDRTYRLNINPKRQGNYKSGKEVLSEIKQASKSNRKLDILVDMRKLIIPNHLINKVVNDLYLENYIKTIGIVVEKPINVDIKEFILNLKLPDIRLPDIRIRIFDSCEAALLWIEVPQIKDSHLR